METLPGFEVVRAHASRSLLRAEGDEGLGMLEVRFSVFDEWYRIRSWWEGDFIERIQRGAFAKTITENRDRIRVQFQHGMDWQIGDKFLGTIDDLREDPDAGVADVGLFDTSYNRDLLPGLRAGQYGASMRMTVIKDEWNEEPGRTEHNPDGVPERTITEVRLHELGPVPFGANPTASAGMRSGTDDFYEWLARRDPERVDALRSTRNTLRTPPDDAAGSTTAPSDGAAPSTTHDEPGSSHSGGLSAAQRDRLITLKMKGA